MRNPCGCPQTARRPRGFARAVLVQLAALPGVSDTVLHASSKQVLCVCACNQVAAMRMFRSCPQTSSRARRGARKMRAQPAARPGFWNPSRVCTAGSAPAAACGLQKQRSLWRTWEIPTVRRVPPTFP